MAKMSDFTLLTNLTLSSANDYIVGYQADLTSAAINFRISIAHFLTYLYATLTLADITTAEVTTYLSTLNFIGYDSADSSNKRITFADLKTSLESTTGLDLREMNANSIKILAGGQQAAVAALTDNTGGTAGNTVSGNNVAEVTDSTGGSTANTTLGAVGDTSAGDESGNINDNFAKVAVCLNALVTALNNGNDLASVTAKVNALIQDFKDIGLMAT